MKAMWQIFTLCLVFSIPVLFIFSCGDDDDDDDDSSGDDDDDSSTGGDDCESLCQRGFDCFGDSYWEYAGVSSQAECVETCETDLAGASSSLADCIFGCSSVPGCDDWAACMAACAGY